MFERTISTYTFGKAFAVTGWRVGYAIGGKDLLAPMSNMTMWMEGGFNRPASYALGKGILIAQNEKYEGKNNFFEYLVDMYQEKMEKLEKILQECSFKFKPFRPNGGIFMVTDISDHINRIPKKYFYKTGKCEDSAPVKDLKALETPPDFSSDYAFARWLAHDFSVAPIPVSFFYNNTEAKDPRDFRGANLIRFPICRTDKDLEKLRENLSKKIE